MGRVKAETRSKKRERGTSFPWCAFRSSVSRVFNINIMHCADASKPPHVGYTHPSQDTHVFTKGVARREGCLPPCRQSWYCAPAYTYVTRDLRRYTVSGPYSTAALKTGRIGTQLPAPWTPMVVVDRGENINRVQTFSEIFDPRSWRVRTHVWIKYRII